MESSKCPFCNPATDQILIQSPTAIALRDAFPIADGHMLVCDYFKRDTTDNGAMKGGHELNDFFRLVQNHPLHLIEDIDITEQTAPTIDLLDDALSKVGKPVMDSLVDFLAARYPAIYKLVKWKFRDELEKINNKYSGGNRTGEHFEKFKTYRLLLYHKGNSWQD